MDPRLRFSSVTASGSRERGDNDLDLDALFFDLRSSFGLGLARVGTLMGNPVACSRVPLSGKLRGTSPSICVIRLDMVGGYPSNFITWRELSYSTFEHPL